jgi:hypothetical protein
MTSFISQYSQRGIQVIGRTDPTSTLGLIEQSDTSVLSCRRAALEPAILGKPVIAPSPSSYRDAGFQSSAGIPEELGTLTLLHNRKPERRGREIQSIAHPTFQTGKLEADDSEATGCAAGETEGLAKAVIVGTQRTCKNAN